jgi:hypothetical protein
MPDIRTERMCADDMALAVDWAAAEGWNSGLDDAAAFHAADPDGHFLTRIDGRPGTKKVAGTAKRSSRARMRGIAVLGP